MATWVTHLMIADAVLNRYPNLDRRGFCVGNIAPDCNVENSDWTAFTPSREVTHWMQGARKKASDCDAFCKQYILNRRNEIKTSEEYAFLLGYYAHLITDAAFQSMIRNEERVASVWTRIKSDAALSKAVEGMSETWDNAKKLIPKRVWINQIYSMEAAYLQSRPDSGYLTEILPLTEFPDYIDYLPAGAVVRKIGVMGYMPNVNVDSEAFVAVSRKEYDDFVSETIDLVVKKIADMCLK